jgi:phosphonate transport system permease protein
LTTLAPGGGPGDLARLRERHPEVFRPPIRDRAGGLVVVGLLFALLVFGLWRLGFDPWRLLLGIGNLGDLVVLMVPPLPKSWPTFVVYLGALAETVAIALLGTLGAAVLAQPVAFLAARNTTIHRLVQFLTRRLSDSVRGVDQLIWALIWVSVVGLGPFAGVLAVMTGEFGTFTKLFSETIETADRRPVEGVLSTGGSRLQAIRFGVLPQVLPVMASQVLYFFESNTRSGTIIGIVGAGGIGLHLSEQIRSLEWPSALFIILMILILVAVIDLISSRLRRSIIGRREGPVAVAA